MRRAPSPPPLAERRKPGLSETLPGLPRPDRCKGCGESADLLAWSECNEWDEPQRPAILLVLCQRCSDRLINAHPRLYLRVDRLEPRPGIMALCVDCLFRRGLQCAHPKLKANGGAGLEVQFPQPSMMHLNYGGGRGEWRNFYPGPPTACAGRDVGTDPASVAPPATESHR